MQRLSQRQLFKNFCCVRRHGFGRRLLDVSLPLGACGFVYVNTCVDQTDHPNCLKPREVGSIFISVK